MSDLEETGLAFLQLKSAVEKANKTLTPLTMDKSIDMFTRSEIRTAVLLLREALM